MAGNMMSQKETKKDGIFFLACSFCTVGFHRARENSPMKKTIIQIFAGFKNAWIHNVVIVSDMQVQEILKQQNG